MQKYPSASCLEILPAFRLLEKGNVGTFLRRLLIALALLPLPFVIRLLNYLARFAAFTNSQEPLVVGKARDAFASLFVFTETCRGGFFGGASGAAFITVVEIAWVGHGWREGGVCLGVVL